LKLIVQDNGGKASALVHGIREARHAVIVFLDADTQFVRETLRELVQPLRNEKVGAVSGHALVGNPRTWIARFQALEYVCGFNLDRRAYDSCNAITVAPGAVSAFRREAIDSVGGIASDTLAEDTDLTLALHRGGWKVAYTSKAVAWTEAPEHVRALAKQRFRWAFGTMQCLWKHRDMLFNARYGWLGCFSLPGICIFQILLVATIPLVDGLLLLSLLGGAGGVFIWYFVAFLLADLLLAFLACAIEEEKPGKALLILPMRFFYRPLLAFVVWKSILHILRGVWVGWGKLERRGSVVVPREGGS
jgi:cellulose synthase/poly-beta-1,6-N-acetylglucosamine synthase-like glycosyltransferase